MKKLTNGLLLSVFVLSFLVSSCGYKLASEQPTVVSKAAGGSNKTIKIKKITNPTLYPWLSHYVNTTVHDEINFRKIAQWVDSGDADYTLEVNIEKFYISDYGYSVHNNAVMYSATMYLNLKLFDGSTNKEVWSSGTISLYRVYDTNNSQTASKELAVEVIRRAMDRMQFAF